MIKRSKAEWLALIEAHKKSGLSAAAFCREHKLCPKYFSLRRRQLAEELSISSDLSGSPSKFVPAVIPPSPNRNIKISAGQVCLEIPMGVEPSWLATVVKCLQG